MTILASPTQGYAQSSTSCKTKLAKAKAHAEKSLVNAEDAEKLTRKAKAAREDAVKARDDYAKRLALAKTQRDQLAGELASTDTRLKTLDFKNAELITRTSALEAEVGELSRARWYYLAVGVFAGAAVVGSGAIWLSSR